MDEAIPFSLNLRNNKHWKPGHNHILTDWKITCMWMWRHIAEKNKKTFISEGPGFKDQRIFGH